jgi:hypothetical protein
MLNRKTILRVLLWALGIAALTGATAMVAGGRAITGRIAGTAVLVALACLALLPLMGMIDSARKRSAGLMGMAGVVCEFLLAMALLWDLDGGIVRSDTLFFSMFVLLLATPAAMLFLWSMQTQRAAWAGRVGVILTGLITAMALLGLVTERDHRWGDDLLETSGASAIFAAILCASLVSVGGTVWKRVRWLGTAKTALAWCMACVGIWWPQVGLGGEFGKHMAAVGSVGFVIGYASLALLVPLKPGQLWLRWVAIASTLATAVAFDLAIYTEHDPVARLGGAAAIIAGCATLGLMLMARLNRGVQAESLPHEFSRVALTCPRCQRSQSMPLGDSACQACGLRISVRVEEPRCAKCGYLLYQVEGNACPECGSAIADFPGRTAVA